MVRWNCSSNHQQQVILAPSHVIQSPLEKLVMSIFTSFWYLCSHVSRSSKTMPSIIALITSNLRLIIVLFLLMLFDRSCEYTLSVCIFYVVVFLNYGLNSRDSMLRPPVVLSKHSHFIIQRGTSSAFVRDIVWVSCLRIGDSSSLDVSIKISSSIMIVWHDIN